MENELIHIPEAMIGGKSTLFKEFSEFAIKENKTDDFAILITKLLPNEFRTTTVWFDNLTKMWRYYFGPPIDKLQTDIVWTGTTNHLPLINLYKAIKIAYQHLTSEQLDNYINRLKNFSKHIDVLFEMRPLMNVGNQGKKYFEDCGYCLGNKTIDWRINILGFNIMFDVKNRVKDLVNHLEEISPYIIANANTIMPPAPDPKDLFKSVEDKFLERKYYTQLQGVWIQTQIKAKKSTLDKYFYEELNPEKVHFVIISDWKEDAYILTRNKLIKYILKKLFHIKESDRFVTENYI